MPAREPSTARRRALGIVVALAIVAFTAMAVGADTATSSGLRTTQAETRSVEQVLDTVGTVEPVSQATMAFPSAGTVATVEVELGDEVGIGETLASLETTALDRSLTAARAALDQAELTLSLALSGEDPGSGASGGAPTGALGRPVSTGTAALAPAQQAVLDGQQEVDAAMADAGAALANASTVCAEAPSETADPEPTTEPLEAEDSACLVALQTSIDAQSRVAAAQEALDEAMTALTALLQELAEAPADVSADTAAEPAVDSPVAGRVDSTDGSPTSDQASSSGGGAAATASPTVSSPSAEDLVAYQKAVDAAALDVVVAAHAVEQSQLASVVAGTVVSVGLEAGDEVSAASSTQNIVVVTDDGFEVTTVVSVNDLPDVDVGQVALVTPDAGAEPLEGQVVRIGIIPDTSGGTPSYDVSIGLSSDTSTLGNGSTASVSIVTAGRADALAVPTSAVAIEGDAQTVRVLDDDEVVSVPVTIGAVGQTWTEVVRGLDEGDTVVLADLDEPLPGTATDGSAANAATGAASAGPGAGRRPGG